MPPQRNTVSPGYVQDILAETLNAMHPQMPEEAFGESWIPTAVEDERIEETTAIAVKNNRYAVDAGHVEARTPMLACGRRRRGARSSIPARCRSASARSWPTRPGCGPRSKSSDRTSEETHPSQLNETRNAFAGWIIAIGKILGIEPSVTFVGAPYASFVAKCTASSAEPLVTINTSYCPDPWLAMRGHEQLDLIIHELSHAIADTPMEHGPKWGDACALSGAMIADGNTADFVIHLSSRSQGSGIL